MLRRRDRTGDTSRISYTCIRPLVALAVQPAYCSSLLFSFSRIVAGFALA